MSAATPADHDRLKPRESGRYRVGLCTVREPERADLRCSVWSELGQKPIPEQLDFGLLKVRFDVTSQ